MSPCSEFSGSEPCSAASRRAGEPWRRVGPGREWRVPSRAANAVFVVSTGMLGLWFAISMSVERAVFLVWRAYRCAEEQQVPESRSYDVDFLFSCSVPCHPRIICILPKLRLQLLRFMALPHPYTGEETRLREAQRLPQGCPARESGKPSTEPALRDCRHVPFLQGHYPAPVVCGGWRMSPALPSTRPSPSPPPVHSP